MTHAFTEFANRLDRLQDKARECNIDCHVNFISFGFEGLNNAELIIGIGWERDRWGHNYSTFDPDGPCYNDINKAIELAEGVIESIHQIWKEERCA